MAEKKAAGFGFAGVLRDLTPEARLFILAVSLSRLTSFMVLPFLTIILNQRLGVSIVEIGTLFTLGAFAGLAAAPVAGFVADGMSKRKLMTSAVVLSVFCFLVLAFVPNFVAYCAAILIMSVAGGVLEPLLRSTLGEFAENEEQRPALFHIRYYIVNIAGAVGPLMGLWFVETGSNALFLIAAASNIFLAYVIAKVAKEPAAEASQERRGSSLAVLKQVLAHRIFVAVFLSNLLLVIVYSQTDEPLTFHMINSGVEDIARIVTLLTVTNTVVVLVLHGLFMKQIMAMGERLAFVVAIFCLGAALAMIALNTGQMIWIWVLAIGISTLGEIIAMPLFLTIIDRSAPEQQRNSFFGIYMLSNLGGALVPLFSAFAIQAWGGAVLFWGAAFFCLPLAAIGFSALKEAVATPEQEGNHCETQ